MSQIQTNAQVWCYAGGSYAQRPQAFLWQGQRLEVAAVTAEWRTPDGKTFLVRTPNGQIFKLVYNHQPDDWQVELIDLRTTKETSNQI